MGDIDQRRTVVLKELARTMVTQIAGQVDVDVSTYELVEKEVPRAATHSHSSYDAIGITRDTHSGRCRRECRGHR